MMGPGGFGGPGRDLLTNIEISSLKEQVSNLTTEKYKAEEEANRLRFELEKLGADPNYLARLEEKVKRLEREEAEARDRIARTLADIADLNDAAERSRKFTEAFGEKAQEQFNRLQENWEKKNFAVNIVGAFVLGVVASVVAAYLMGVLPHPG